MQCLRHAVAFLDGLHSLLRQLREYRLTLARLGNAVVDNEVEKPEQAGGSFRIIAEVELPGMDGVVADHTERIEGLLDFDREALVDERADVVVDVLAGLAKLRF